MTILPVVAQQAVCWPRPLSIPVFNYRTPAASGWGIPTATDIAFAVGILTMLETQFPVSLRVFLMALAIADDLGAILAIALFYGSEGSTRVVCCLLLIMVGIYVMNRLGGNA